MESLFFRKGTQDEVIFRKVLEENEYHLPDSINPDDIIIDIGTHIGGFTYACLQRGAKKIYSYEAYNENYEVAKINLDAGIKKGYVNLHNLAVWRSDYTIEQLPITKSDDSTNTGGGSVVWDGKENLIKTISLDEILGSIGRVTLLKLDCEGAEYPILLTSKKLALVDYICGEYHNTNVGTAAIVNGKKSFNRNDLGTHLKNQGFDCAFLQTNSQLGLFFARKKHKRTFFKGVKFKWWIW